jgi:hypothetical protein
MKIIRWTFLLAIFVVCSASKYANVLTNWQGDTKPDPITLANGDMIQHPTLQQYQAAGYRYVTMTNAPAETNLTALTYTAVDIDGTNCILNPLTTYNWVAANAQAASNAAIAYTQNLASLSNQIQQTVAGTNANYAVNYSLAYWLIQTMVKSGVTNNTANAQNAIIKTANGQVK